MKTEKKTLDIPDSSDFQNSWTVENAMYILNHPTVDSETWSEAVEWLLLYGPEEVKEMLHSASDHATKTHFPDLKPKGYNDNGEPIYDIDEIAKLLGIDKDDVKSLLTKKESLHKKQHQFSDEDKRKIH